MKVYELIALLMERPAGEEVLVCDNCLTYQIESVDHAEGNVFIYTDPDKEGK